MRYFHEKAFLWHIQTSKLGLITLQKVVIGRLTDPLRYSSLPWMMKGYQPISFVKMLDNSKSSQKLNIHVTSPMHDTRKHFGILACHEWWKDINQSALWFVKMLDNSKSFPKLYIPLPGMRQENTLVFVLAMNIERIPSNRRIRFVVCENLWLLMTNYWNRTKI